MGPGASGRTHRRHSVTWTQGAAPAFGIARGQDGVRAMARIKSKVLESRLCQLRLPAGGGSLVAETQVRPIEAETKQVQWLRDRDAMEEAQAWASLPPHCWPGPGFSLSGRRVSPGEKVTQLVSSTSSSTRTRPAGSETPGHPVTRRGVESRW